METFYVLATWLDVFAISAVMGVAACELWVVPRSVADAEWAVLWRWLGAAAGLITLSSCVVLASRTLEMSGALPGRLAQLVPLVLAKTHYGSLWLVRLGALAALWAAWLLSRRRVWRRAAIAAALIALAVVCFTRSATGHAGGHGNYSPAVWVDVLHLLGVSLWIGTLLAMSVAVFPRLPGEASAERVRAADIFSRLSTVSGVALVMIIATGIYNAAVGLGQVSALWQSRYGLVLIAKLALVAWMIGIGAHNRYVKLPRLARWAGFKRVPQHAAARLPGVGPRIAKAAAAPASGPLQHCERAVRLESLLGLCALLAAALLHHTMPPADVRSLQPQTLTRSIQPKPRLAAGHLRLHHQPAPSRQT